MYKKSFGAPTSGRSQTFRSSRFGRKNTNSQNRNGQFIHPDRFIHKAEALGDTPVFIPQHNFADFDLEPRLKQAVAAHGWVTPTPIQDEAIPYVLKGRDLVGLANTGTGKTAAFLLPILNKLLTGQTRGTALIVVPTRELAVQIDVEFRALAKHLSLYSALCVGGVNIGGQIAVLRRRPQVIIGTPGRLKDLLLNRHLDLSQCHTVVLDEADRMLDMGFVNDIKFLIGYLPAQRQSLCFSATITPEISSIIANLLHDPITVSVRTSDTSRHVEQNVLHADSREEKNAILQDLLAQSDFKKVLIFGQTKHGVQKLSDLLSQKGLTTTAIHGNKSQAQRQRAINDFTQERVQILVATDVAARGLDIPAVTHVINYDLPNTYEDYVHRIGRTGRAGKTGQALTFVPTPPRKY